jgi:hypothetical protein
MMRSMQNWVARASSGTASTALSHPGTPRVKPYCQQIQSVSFCWTCHFRREGVLWSAWSLRTSWRRRALFKDFNREFSVSNPHLSSTNYS